MSKLFTVALSLLLAISFPALSAPVPRHLFPPDTEPKVGWKFYRYGVCYSIYAVDRDLFWVGIGEPGERPIRIFSGPLTAWEVRTLMRGENPDLSRLDRK